MLEGSAMGIGVLVARAVFLFALTAAVCVCAQDVSTNRLDVLKAQARLLLREIDEQADRQRASVLSEQHPISTETGAVTAAGSKMLDAVESERNLQKARVLRRYTTSLDDLVRQLVQQDNLTEAKRARGEKENAAFVLAEAEAALSAADSNHSVSVKPAHAPVFRERVPEGAVEFKGHHYLLFARSSTWMEAKTACSRKGGHLIVINDAAEDLFAGRLISAVTNACEAYWIGLSCDRWERMHLARKLSVEHRSGDIRIIRRDESAFYWVDKSELTKIGHASELTIRLTYRESAGPTTALRSRQDRDSRFGDFVAISCVPKKNKESKPVWLLGTETDRYGHICEWEY